MKDGVSPTLPDSTQQNLNKLKGDEIWDGYCTTRASNSPWHLTKDCRSRENQTENVGRKEHRKGRKVGYTSSGIKAKGLKVQDLEMARLYKDTNEKI